MKTKMNLDIDLTEKAICFTTDTVPVETLPNGLTVYIPVSVIGKFNTYLFLLVIGVTVLLVSLSFLIFYKGLKRYSSSNLMVARA